ncbi:MAG TPA: threonine/serine exporter family protein, partial [Gaiellaceae bacterium]|nr:threonine/serine exporter family protein [Gaiellaceae bacterium]
LGNSVGMKLFGHPPAVTPASMPAWATLVALAVAPLAFTVLLKASPRDYPWFLLVGAIAFYASRLGSMALGPELGSFVGALAVGVASNVLARVMDRPSQLFLVPGILLLVPGSIGIRSLSALMEREVVSGIETAFRMIVIAVSLVAGLLMSNALTPRRRLV